MTTYTADSRHPRLRAAQVDRAAGVLLAAAVGDALGVPYEFAPRFSHDPEMIGGGLGPYQPGEYSDDTQMAVCVAEVAATGIDLTTAEALDAITDRFLDWRHHGATDIGSSTSAAMRGVEAGRGSAARMSAQARRVYEATALGAGNGGLMRTGIVALATLGDRAATAPAARAVCELTHAEPRASESCILWCEAIRVAVLDGRFDLAGGLDLLPETSRAFWGQAIGEATGADPASIGRNGYTVTALQAAWAAITSTIDAEREFECDHLLDALFAAVHAGHDTDTVAAIAGALLGARWGASAVPARHRRLVHGWPGLDAADLVRLALLTARGGRSDSTGWPGADDHPYLGRSAAMAVPHPQEPGVILGTINTPDHGCDAVVTLCRRGRRLDPLIPSHNQVDVWLIDDEDPAKNPNLHFVLDDTAKVIKQLRDEGKTVFVHCVAAHHRTPAVAVAYSRLLGFAPAGDYQIEHAVGSRRNGLLWKTAHALPAAHTVTVMPLVITEVLREKGRSPTPTSSSPTPTSRGPGRWASWPDCAAPSSTVALPSPHPAVQQSNSPENRRPTMSPRIVILTGAGISAESGVPTFRDADGLWENHRVEDVASPEGFRRDPALVQRFYDLRRRDAQTVEPNAAHLALARLERALGDDVLVVTQNIDDLHEQAGSTNLLHMHGDLLRALCTTCGARHHWNDDLSDNPRCPSCGQASLRPDVVWFGEVPHHMDEIAAAVQSCELFVVIGTSGVVYPAAGLAWAARASGAATALLNLEDQNSSEYDDVRLGPATQVVPAWVDEVLACGMKTADA